MADVRGEHDIVTKFILNTCELNQTLNFNDGMALYHCAALANDNCIPVKTGSVAEFYIQPMLSCVGDHDIMIHRSDELAIPAGTAPPTHLPDEFDSRVKVYEIVDSEFPGYVYLISSYLLTECIDDGKYNAVECEERWYLMYGNQERRHGPAFVTEWLIRQNDLIDNAYVKQNLFYSSHCRLPLLGRLAGIRRYSQDAVCCHRCLSWPPQAADWPTRHRNYGWPDSATIDRVVSNGCDVVQVAHRQCRRDEWMNKHQHRLSFSRAEIVLLNSWIPVQQIVCYEFSSR